MTEFPSRLLALQPFWNAWHLDSPLGKGSYGKVYKIYREEFGSRFYSAMKWIPLPARQDDIDRMRSDGMSDGTIKAYYDDRVRDMQNEIKLMNSLRGTSHIVSFEDHAFIRKESGIGWDILIRMELLTPLPKRIHTMTVGDVVRMGIDLCDALALCKKHRIVHRDIKPDNIFISENGDYKLGDFGVARSIQKDQTNLSMKGTPMYMAPEVYLGKPSGISADQYSLGLVMFKLLNAQQIAYEPTYSHVQTNEERDTVFYRRMKGDPLPPPLQGSARLKEIILRACRYQPRKRFPSPEAFRIALESVLKDAACAEPLKLIDGTLPPPPIHGGMPHAKTRYVPVIVLLVLAFTLLIIVVVSGMITPASPVPAAETLMSPQPSAPVERPSQSEALALTAEPTTSPQLSTPAERPSQSEAPALTAKPTMSPQPSVPAERPLPLGSVAIRNDTLDERLEQNDDDLVLNTASPMATPLADNPEAQATPSPTTTPNATAETAVETISEEKKDSSLPDLDLTRTRSPERTLEPTPNHVSETAAPDRDENQKGIEIKGSATGASGQQIEVSITVEEGFITDCTFVDDMKTPEVEKAYTLAADYLKGLSVSTLEAMTKKEFIEQVKTHGISQDIRISNGGEDNDAILNVFSAISSALKTN